MSFEYLVRNASSRLHSHSNVENLQIDKSVTHGLYYYEGHVSMISYHYESVISTRQLCCSEQVRRQLVQYESEVSKSSGGSDLLRKCIYERERDTRARARTHTVTHRFPIEVHLNRLTRVGDTDTCQLDAQKVGQTPVHVRAAKGPLTPVACKL